jgi:glycosyltransferase involved in cell wall biosynthesis
MSRLVSILIPCFNAERWIGQAIESALAQTYMSTEIIVVDDGSTDGSLEVLRRFGQHIRWETGPNRGANVTRNRLLSLSRGCWLQYLDADDYLLPDKIEPQMEFVAEYPDADVIYSPIVVEYWPPEPGSSYHTLIPELHDPWILLVRCFLPQTGAPLWRKSAVEAVGGSPLALYRATFLFNWLICDRSRPLPDLPAMASGAAISPNVGICEATGSD